MSNRQREWYTGLFSAVLMGQPYSWPAKKLSQNGAEKRRKPTSRSVTQTPPALFDLMCLGELFLKSTVLGLVAAIDSDKDRHQYRLLHRLVRVDGVGEWDQVLQETLTGGAAHLLMSGAHKEQKELTMRVAPASWQYEAVSDLHKCLKILNPKEDKLPDKIDGRRWLSMLPSCGMALEGMAPTS